MWPGDVSSRSRRVAGTLAVAAAVGGSLILSSTSWASAGETPTSATPASSASSTSSAKQPNPSSATKSVSGLRSRRLVVSDRPLTGVLGMTPPFAEPGPDPAIEAARIAVEAALARQAKAAARRTAMKDPYPTVMPIRGAGYESGFGARSKLWAVAHSGLDFSASTGTEAIAVVSGTIRAIFLHPAYGNVVQLVRDDGVEFWYCHLSQSLVEPGDRVRQGQAIALTGATGNVTGPHLHFEVRVAGVPTDPGDFLYHTPGTAGSPPAWAYAYSDTPPPGKTIIGYPPSKKDKKDERDKAEQDKDAQDEKGRRPRPSPSATSPAHPTASPDPEPSGSPSPTASPSPSAHPSPSASPSASGSANN